MEAITLYILIINNFLINHISSMPVEPLNSVKINLITTNIICSFHPEDCNLKMRQIIYKELKKKNPYYKLSKGIII